MDHPRSRGVYNLLTDPRLRDSGSSPLARGLPDRAFICAMHARIIPARAGFTRHRGVDQRLVRDHPRSRGVYSSTAASGRSPGGSSPLARGLPRGPDDQRRDPVDHPRSRGVYAIGGVRRDCEARIIPARAGFTRPEVLLGPVPADHPRSRGVYIDPDSFTDGIHGSSPLARGLPGARERAHRRDPDHPRSRGVYHAASGCTATMRGSSPLARGLLPRIPAGERVGRIIPARAGFTHRGLGPRVGGQDHPRSRGVYPTTSPGSSRA